MSTLVEIRNLLVRRAGRPVLEIDHLSLEKGRVLALVGPNGAGKSTLLLVLARLIKPERGDILLNGQPATGLRDRDYRRRIGLVMQDPLLLDMSVYDNIAIGLRFRHVPGLESARRVEAWVERLGIQHLKTRKAATLSGGEAQRVALARAFVLQPELLLLDEPFGALDKKTRTELLRDLKALLPTTGATTLFSTHDDREVNALADSKIELADGKIHTESSV
ncbi:MAG: ATP-binding cassette domain-containing protein [Anaerolineales bacterium]|nr:ATP-binding cassette domain-containing protein [Anaerolineales bacterium]